MSAPEFIYIRVRTATSDLIPPTPNHQWASDHLYLIEGKYEDIALYAGTTVDWIIKIAHLLCDPLGAGRIFTHTTETSDYWYNSPRISTWRQIAQGEPLLPGIYEFEPSNPIDLSKICDRRNDSRTSKGMETSATTFRNDTRQRDFSCVISRLEELLVASRLIPKRLGSDGARSVVGRFSGANEAARIHQFDRDLELPFWGPWMIW